MVFNCEQGKISYHFYERYKKEVRMKNVKNRLRAGTIVCLLIGLGIFTGCRKEESAPRRPGGVPEGVELGAPTVVARVGAQDITEEQLARVVYGYTQDLLRQGQKPPPDFENTIFDLLIESELLYQAGLKMEIPDLDQKVDEMYGRVLSRYPSEQALSEDLTRSNLKLQDMRDSLKKEVIVNYVLGEKVHDQITVTDEEVKKYYDEHQEDLREMERIRAHHILISLPKDATPEQKEEAREKALALKKRIAEGEDFESLAKENSDDLVSARNGGDLGFFSKGQKVPAFEEASWSLEIGQVTDPVETRFGYHLIRVDEKKPAGVPPLAEIRSRIAVILRAMKTPEKLDQLIEELKKEIKVEKFREVGKE